MPSLACLNGEISAPEDAKVSIWDRGFLFGDAVYEVCRIYQGRCWLEDEHMARLKRSLREMRIEGLDIDRLYRRMHDTISRSGIEEGTIYVQITRGVAPRLHAFPDPRVPPTELIVVRPYDDSRTAEKRASGVSVVSRPELRWGRCDVKSTNLLANVVAYQEAAEQGGTEAVLVKPDGTVTEASHSSLLWVRDGQLEGTPEGPGILPGTTRLGVLRLAEAARVPFREITISLQELKHA
ncbi:MAG TPA: aminotransferase class IV, partial [Isosphaeraceae bacterium]|nr:aminotransferase class IV [Isosphaeraceae bacterium]